MTILYDSKCDFCNAFMRFFENNKLGSVVYEKYDLRTAEARVLLREKNVRFVNKNTIYLVEAAAVCKSRAILGIIKKTHFPYCLLYALSVLPRRLADSTYEYVARHRMQLSKLLFKHKSV